MATDFENLTQSNASLIIASQAQQIMELSHIVQQLQTQLILKDQALAAKK